MKQSLFLSIAFLTIILPACNQKSQKQDTDTSGKTSNEKYSPIDGNWELVSTEINGKQTKPSRTPQQFKMLHYGFLSVFRYNDSGNFAVAGAGTYEVNGNTIKETVVYHSDTAAIGAKDWQKWEMKSDTLIFYGFEKIEMPDGKDITQEVNRGGKFIEKSIRAKR